MNIVDVIIILFILSGGIIGFKHGSIRQLVSLCGFAVTVILAYTFKTPLAKILCKIFPFFTFKGSLAGVTVLNILLYEIVAFLIILSILTTILQIVILASKVLEKIISLTFIFTIPSKLIGMVLGFIENYILVFIALYILTLPIFQIDILSKSKLKKPILSNTPVLHLYVDKTRQVGLEFLNLKDKYIYVEDKKQLNLEALDLLLKYNITDVEMIDDLNKSGKLKIENVETILKNYRD